MQITWVTGDDALFTQRIMSDNTTPASLAIVDSRGEWSATTGTGDSQREIWEISGTATKTRSIRALVWCGPQFGNGLLPQHGVALKLSDDGSRRRALTIWHDIFFQAPHVLNFGVWAADLAGTSFVNYQNSYTFSTLLRSVSVTAADRTSNVVTLTVGAGHPFVAGDRISVDLADSTYDGPFLVTSVTSTTIVYSQTAANAGTSTGTVSKTFPYWLEVLNPSGSIVQLRAWAHEDTTPPAFVDYDTDAGVDLPGTTGNNVTTPDHADLRVTSDIELWADITPTVWPPAALQTLVARWTGTSNRSFRLDVAVTSGFPVLRWTTAGSTLISIFADAAPTLVNGRVAIKVEFDVDNGAAGRTATFYEAPTAAGPWTQLGTPQTQAGTTSIFAGTSDLELGTFNGGSNSPFPGRIHAAGVRNTAGTVVADVHISNVQNGATSFSCQAGRTWTVNGTAALVNTGIPSGAFEAIAIDLAKVGSEAQRVADPAPTSGALGVVVGHVENDPACKVVYDDIIAGGFEFTPSVIAVSAAVGSPGGSIAAGPSVIAGQFNVPALGVSVTASPAVVSTAVTAPQTSVSADFTVSPAAISTTAALPQAVVSVGASPAAAAATAAIPRPAVSVSASPTVLAATTAIPQPAATVTAAPSVVAAVAALPEATAIAGGSGTVTPATIATTTSVPSVAVNTAAGPSTIPGTTTVPASSVHVTASPATVAASVSVPAPEIPTAISPSTIAASVTVPGSMVSVAAQVGAVTTAITVVQPSVNITAAPGTFATAVSVPQATVDVTTIVAPAVTAAQVTVPQPAVNVVAGPSAFATVVSVPQVTVGATLTATVVAAQVAIPQPGAAVGAGPVTVATTVRIPGVASVGQPSAIPAGPAIVVKRNETVVVKRSSTAVLVERPSDPVPAGR